MNIRELEANTPLEQEARSRKISIGELVAAVIQRRYRIALVTGIGAVLFVVYMLLTPNEYTSTAQLMPPDPQAFSSASSLLEMRAMGLAASIGGGFFSQATPGGIAVAILDSPVVQNAIINRFDLLHVYHRKLYVDARKSLANHTTITDDRRSGIITIAVMDVDPNRAREIAQAYVDQLNQLTSELSTSSARRERIFLEQELNSVKTELNASTEKLGQFSSRTGTIDPERQGEATMTAAGRLQGEIIVAESELSALKSTYTDDNFRVRAAQSRVAELQNQLQKMRGTGAAASDTDTKSDEPFPSIGKLPLLGVGYYDLYRQVRTDQAIYETLTKEYELAKVEEAKEVPKIVVLSSPMVPERKTSPHRSVIVMFGTFVTFILAIGAVVGKKAWDLSGDSFPLKAAIKAFRRSL